MSDEEKTTVEGGPREAIDLDTDPTTDLEAAMRDALEAVESVTDSGDEAAQGELESPAAGEGATDLETQLEAQREMALRALADLENYRKRVQRERQDEKRFRAFEPMRGFLPVIDNLERALASEGSVDDLKQGVQMILRQMTNLLKDNGVRRVEAIGRPFDPSVHEAVSREEDANVTAPMVSDEMQSGYTMHDRLLRPAVVRVSMPASAGDSGEEEEA